MYKRFKVRDWSCECGLSIDAFGRIVAAVSNAEAFVAYAYTGDLLDGGYSLALSNGVVFAREARHPGTYLRERVVSVTNSSPVATNGWQYGYDALGRPVARNADVFAYNSCGEVTNAVVSGFAETHEYDLVGNPYLGSLGGAEHYYDVNELNQVYSRRVMTVGEEAFSFGLDGSLVHSAPCSPDDPRDEWSYAYDAKSRLVSAWRRACGTSDFVFAVSNSYDHLDRRVRKVTPEKTHTYFYDGWLLIKEVVASTNGTTDVVEYHWGKDLSGTIGGAGGVGGLLYMKRNGAIYIPYHDAYGNVMGYWDAQGNVVAEYTYDAFGKLIASSGSIANTFSFRYSTKYFDPETGFYYYGYRFYSPDLMRWITRDPIGEEGGENLYLFCGNNGACFIDYLGLYLWYIIHYHAIAIA